VQQTTVTVSAETDENARIEGAQQLGVQPEDVEIVSIDEKTYAVSIKDMPGQFDIGVLDDKMGAVIRTITPPLGRGKPVKVEDIEHALADLKIVFGIDKEAIKNTVSEVINTRTACNNIQVAAGEPAQNGQDGRIDLKIGQNAVNKTPNANMMVKPGQIIAVRIPAAKGSPGKNIFGEEVPAKKGNEADFSSGDNVTVTKDGNALVAAIYGTARLTRNIVSVENPVKVDKSGMWAKMAIFPTLADNSKLTYNDVSRALEQVGVISGIKEDSIIKAIEANVPLRNLMVAEAVPAKDGVDARIEFKFRLNGDDPEAVDAARKDGKLSEASVIKELFSAGDVLAIKTLPEKPLNGTTITGKPLSGAEPKDKQITPGANVTILDDGVTFVVAEGILAGYADFINGQVCVTEPLIVSEELADRGIVHGIDGNAIEQAIDEAASKNVPLHDVVIAEGRAAQQGEDAKIELKFQSEKSAGTIDEHSGVINYKERKSLQSVKKETLLAVKTPPTPGTEGIDVFGNIIPAKPGREKDLKPTGNVKISEDGLGFISEIDGIVFLSPENKIWISKQYEVHGDVDYSTGNLSMEGSLDIKGWVRSGFEVRASDDIKIGGGVEDAIVEAGTDIYINGGIIGSAEGKVKAGGNITARFFESARAHADGDIFVHDDILRSTVTANGSIIVTKGKGRIRGGSVEAAKGVEVNEIGSDAGIKTSVSVGTDSKTRKLLAKAKKQLEDFKRKRAKTDKALARFVIKYKSKTLPTDMNRKLEKLVKFKREIVRKEALMVKYRQKLLKEISETETESVEVKVNKVVYSGTTIIINGYFYHVKEDIEGKALFVLNEEQQAVELAT